MSDNQHEKITIPESGESESHQAKILMLISIGPVQEFIAQARRTRDLWFGSFLLSEMSKAGANAFKDEFSGELMYPFLENQHATDSNAPNKILGIVHTNNPYQVAERIRFVITGEWKRYARLALEWVEPYVNLGTWTRQVSDLVEFYATWIDLDKVTESKAYKAAIAGNVQQTPYSYALSRVESLMAARKLLRDFKPNEPGALFGETKSSLDGGRESVWINPDRYEAQLLKLGMKKNEALDAISVIKRLSLKFAPYKERFVSVCETAFLPYRHLISENTELRQAVEVYLGKVNALIKASNSSNTESSGATLDEARLFYARRIEEYLDETIQVSVAQKQSVKSKIEKELEDLYSGEFSKGIIHRRLLPRPTPYYAFLVADGDHMGKQLRRIQAPEQHVLFSRALSEFAKQAAIIMKDHQGRLVYGGGDDVMAYLPIHSCLDAANELKDCFSDYMKKVLPPESDYPPSLSIGLVIAHMLEPLEEVRAAAVAAERQAKETRDSLALYFYKRSGGDAMRFVFPFPLDPVGQMKKIREWRGHNYFSNKFAYELRELYQTYSRLYQDSDWLKDQNRLSSLLLMEIERLVYKKRPDGISLETVTNWFEKEWKPTIQLQEKPLQSLKHLAEQFIVTIQLMEAESQHE